MYTDIIYNEEQKAKYAEKCKLEANADCYDKENDRELWRHPFMFSLMAVMEASGYTAMSKDFQICLVKAAIRTAEELKLAEKYGEK